MSHVPGHHSSSSSQPFGKRYMGLTLLIVLGVSLVGTFVGLAVMDHLPFSEKNKDKVLAADTPAAPPAINDDNKNTPQNRSTPPNSNSNNNDDALSSVLPSIEEQSHSETNNQNGVNEKKPTLSPKEAVDALMQNAHARVEIKRDMSIQDIITELKNDSLNADRLKGFLLFARKASHLFLQNDSNKRRASSVGSLAKLANVLLMHIELQIEQPILPLQKLSDGRGGLYLDPLVLWNIKALPGETGLRFLKALRLYVLYLTMEATILQEEGSVELLDLIDDIKKYISEVYESKF